ncbi:hypothetical protein, variant [Blastomyces dermatitidis ER-3]|uniref:Uncharacterized protein n=1 Tax=Ajellomyces dermatitidis (strain ER-3 / ATCC MYA-2586) TaxID=559297 RepID=A0ABX2VT57_AJEDR|nr:hypothetical protein, variant [Blastomyces dermatitidis ER-3]OAT00385.1 hypothetical protein, variant [Blastomyces dermatitidis ER-3]
MKNKGRRGREFNSTKPSRIFFRRRGKKFGGAMRCGAVRVVQGCLGGERFLQWGNRDHQIRLDSLEFGAREWLVGNAGFSANGWKGNVVPRERERECRMRGARCEVRAAKKSTLETSDQWYEEYTNGDGRQAKRGGVVAVGRGQNGSEWALRRAERRTRESWLAMERRWKTRTRTRTRTGMTAAGRLSCLTQTRERQGEDNNNNNNSGKGERMEMEMEERRREEEEEEEEKKKKKKKGLEADTQKGGRKQERRGEGRNQPRDTHKESKK